MYRKQEIFMMLCFNEEFYLPLLQRVIDKENGTADNLMLGYLFRAEGEGGRLSVSNITFFLFFLPVSNITFFFFFFSWNRILLFSSLPLGHHLVFDPCQTFCCHTQKVICFQPQTKMYKTSPRVNHEGSSLPNMLIPTGG